MDSPICGKRGEARATHDFVSASSSNEPCRCGLPSRQNIDSLAVPTISVRGPIRMRRPPATLEKLRLSPPEQARWKHAARLERVPLIPAGAKPFVLFGWRHQQCGQRMRGVPGFFSSARTRSGTMTGLSATGLMPANYDLRPDCLRGVRRFTEA